jgi:clan AA aspartic protease (TIGR02281 family)
MASTVRYILRASILVHLLATGCNYSVITIDENPAYSPKRVDDTCSVFWSAMKHLDLYCTFPAISTDEAYFLAGMRKFFTGQWTDADSIFNVLMMTTQDTAVKLNAREVLVLIRTEEGDWTELRKVYESFKETPPGFSGASQFIKNDSYSLPEIPETLAVEINSFGIPVVDVMVNGRRKKFWLDTGASEIVISSGIANECDITAIDTLTENVMTATTSISAAITVVDQFSIGRYTMSNIPAIIVEKKYLEKSVLGILKDYSIEGIIGWRALKNICFTIDLPNTRIILEKPRLKDLSRKNLYWCEYPLLLFRTPFGDTAKFFFDSGAKNSSAHPDIIDRMPGLERSDRIISFQGIGGNRTLIGESIDRIEMFSHDVRITFEAFPVMSVGRPKFVSIDGIIGNDLLKKGKFTVDYRNREFEFIPGGF